MSEDEKSDDRKPDPTLGRTVAEYVSAQIIDRGIFALVVMTDNGVTIAHSGSDQLNFRITLLGMCSVLEDSILAGRGEGELCSVELSIPDGVDPH